MSSRNSGIRRFLEDLRAVGDRRVTADRRVSAQHAPDERRRFERRRPADRRERQYEAFSLTDTALIQTMLADETIAASCPECDGPLLLGPPILRKGYLARRVQCTGCSTSTLIRDLGELDSLIAR